MQSCPVVDMEEAALAVSPDGTGTPMQLERGDLRGAQRREVEATTLYRDAELDAIKDQYLSETRRLLGWLQEREINGLIHHLDTSAVDGIS